MLTLSNRRPWAAYLFIALVAAPGTGCIKKMAVNAVANTLSGGTGGFASDDDPELVGDALPFALKTMESLLVEVPEHEGLLVATASGFTQYTKVYVEYEADYIEGEDYSRAKEMRARAKNLYVRAMGYGFRAMELKNPNFRKDLRDDPTQTLSIYGKEDVATMYWLAAAWASAISIAKHDASLAADLDLTEALMNRVRELDPAFGGGAVFDYFIAYDASRPEAAGGSVKRAREELALGRKYSKGQRATPLVAFAETGSVAKQDREEFERLLNEALKIDPDAAPEYRLANIVVQKRARWLLNRTEELFLE